MSRSEADYQFNWTEFDRLTAERGWATDDERARRLGISPGHLSNLRSKVNNPGLKVFAALKRCGLYDAVVKEPEVEEVA